MGQGLILSDAHTHVGTEKERREREEQGIVSLVCASTPDEAEIIFSQRGKCLIPTCGVHPWYVEKWGLEPMEQWIERCPVIGEIGMDSVWCGVPLSLQEEVFRRQLKMACRQKKPVILHTKGQEQKIARIIREYPNRYLVHWYSCRDHLEEYLDQDCYFSIGPDVWWNQAVADVARKVSVERLFIETDGLNGVKWAYDEGRKVLGEQKQAEESVGWSRIHGQAGVKEALTETLETVAAMLGLSSMEAGKIFYENLVLGFLDNVKI